MAQRRDSLSPPERPETEVADPGAHELDATSDSEDHFSDAQSGPVESRRASPIPRTRVEKVDNSPSYGEVPGTEAYRKREGDAAPDEIAIIPDRDSLKLEVPDSGTPGSGSGGVSSPTTPGGHPIPKTVVEEAPDSPGSFTNQQVAHKRRTSDAHPDVVLRADGSRVEGGEQKGEEKEKEEGDAPSDTPITPTLQSPSSPTRTRRESSTSVRPHGMDVDEAVGDDFGDDFDDFEEGDEDGDFGDFDQGFPQSVPTTAPEPIPAAPAPPATPPPPSTTVPPAMSMSLPIPEFDDLDTAEVIATASPFLDALFPPDDHEELYHVHDATQDDPHSRNPHRSLAPDAGTNPVFLTPRSASLWSQLVAPPPLQPPDWIRSRIRRLFLVSLGVPVDLDEILPASTKQKKLVLPSLRRPGSTGSLRTTLSADSHGRSSSRRRTRNGGGGGAAGKNSSNGDGGGVAGASASGGSAAASGAAAAAAAAAGQGETNSSSSSSKQQQPSQTNNPSDSGSAATRKGPPPEPRFNLVSARQLCATTDEALNGMMDDQLQAHVGRIKAMEETAKEVLEYWTKRTDEKIGDREAFEGVIENLVKHARKVRK